MIKVFEQIGDFEACNAAERWLTEQGYSVGEMERTNPRGIVRGQFYVTKWSRYSRQQHSNFDGRMTGDFRSGPVYVEIKDHVFAATEVQS